MRFDPVMYALAKKGGSGGGGGGAPADWNAKEGEAGYVKNRTHWEEEGIVALVDNQTFEFDTSGIAYGGPALAEFLATEEQALKIGKTYTVIWDGVVYESLVCFEDDGSPSLGFSYASFENGSLEYPFKFFCYLDSFDPLVGIMTPSPDQTHTVSILGKGSVIHHLDPKYIKDMYYEEEGIVKLVDNETLTGFAEIENGIYAVQIASDWIHIEVGKTYTVVWDGESYECECIEVEGVPYLGNPNYFMTQTGGDYPFACFRMGTVYLLTEQTSESHTVTILTEGMVVHRLDPKYLSGTMFYCTGNNRDTLFKDTSLNDPVEEVDVEEAIKSGGIIIDGAVGSNRPCWCTPTYIEHGGNSGYTLFCPTRAGGGVTFYTGDFEGGDE